MAKTVLNGDFEMMSKIPADLSKVEKEANKRQILRTAIMAELDAINLYDQMAASAEDSDVKKVLLEVAREEKTHIGEFQAMLLRFDREQVQELEKGKREVEELVGK